MLREGVSPEFIVMDSENLAFDEKRLTLLSAAMLSGLLQDRRMLIVNG